MSANSIKNLIYSFLLILLFNCNSSIHLENLIDEVEVIRDKFGINHIYANNQEDLFFMQGYLAAKDRLFQFENMEKTATEQYQKFLAKKS